MSDPALLARKIRAAFPPCTLGDWPTPLEAAPGLAAANGLRALWLKREDRSSTLYGGNKVRGLEFLFGGVPAGTAFVTIGGTGSTHCLATAIHARRVSCHTVVAQFPQPVTAASRAVADACRRAVDHAVLARSRVGMPLAVARAWAAARRIGPARWIPGGGAAPAALIGHLLAGLELAATGLEPPDAIVTPLGSGGTAAGIALAVAQLGWPTHVVGVRVAPLVVANRWRVAWLARAARRRLETHGVVVADRTRGVVITLPGIGKGYGHPTAAGERAGVEAARHGLVLDPAYGAKAFATLRTLGARGYQRIVFWHTFAAPPSGPESAE